MKRTQMLAIMAFLLSLVIALGLLAAPKTDVPRSCEGDCKILPVSDSENAELYAKLCVRLHNQCWFADNYSVAFCPATLGDDEVLLERVKSTSCDEINL